MKQIEKNDFDLSPGKYVGFSKEKIDETSFEDTVKNFLNEYKILKKKSENLDKEILDDLKKINYE